ncbi:MAG: hypothetical protein JW934_15040 [Anaerolineae bacterium]|nr:hypothetical protein [Anaerolineae bacterium]
MNTMIYPNGIDVDTGTYAIPPMDVDALDALIRGEKEPENFNELKARARRPKHLGVKEGVDERKLEQTGWGIIFADDADPAAEAALQPLIDLRRNQAGSRYHRYDFQVGKDSKSSFLAKQGAGPGPANPDKVPYYLLIVGSPEKIPYEFQSQLDVQYAVGRLDFETVAEYRAYAESVVAVESKAVKLPRRAGFFGVTHENPDTATNQSLDYLIKPLYETLRQSSADWQFDTVLGLEAKKAALRQWLGGSETPALLFAASHGLQVRADNQKGLSPQDYQGALICADWPGQGPFEHRDFVFAGTDLGQDANLLGLIAFFFACFSGGTPQRDAYTNLRRMQIGQQPGPAIELTPHPFVAGLPKRMLSAPAGGALAVIGHVERAWPSSFVWLAKEDGTIPPQTEVFESTLKRLMKGYPVGAAVEYLNQRYAELATDLKQLLEDAQYPEFKQGVQLANTWMAANDAQWYTIIGDPAVRLPVVETTEARPRPVLVSTAATPAADQAGEKPDKPGAAPQSLSSADRAHPTKEETMTTPESNDPRFAHAYSPVPEPEELIRLKAQHPDLYQAYVDHVKAGYENNGRIFDDVRRAFMRSHNSTVVMYWLLFAVGVATVVTGIVLAAQGNVGAGIVFLGVGFAAFVTYFIGRSTQSIEENLLYITWLGVIYNSYWTHLAWATQRDTAQTELDKATTDALQQLEKLVNRHAKGIKSRPTLPGDNKPPEE